MRLSVFISNIPPTRIGSARRDDANEFLKLQFHSWQRAHDQLSQKAKSLPDRVDEFPQRNFPTRQNTSMPDYLSLHLLFKLERISNLNQTWTEMSAPGFS